LLGSAAEDVVRTSVAPVLFVGPGMRAEWELGEEPPVIAGLDGSKPALAAAQAAGDLDQGSRASVGGRTTAPTSVPAVSSSGCDLVPYP
jgi:nucleotide-binding universal stress UspA family protein